VNDTSNYERAEIAERLGQIYQIRFDIYQLKFAIKALNNLLAQVTPYLFYLIGGYLAITGRFDLGGLLAVINAYKDLPGPVKELIDWYQQLQDVQIKYEQVIEQFTPEGLLPPDYQAPVDAEKLQGPVAFSNVILFEDGERKSLDGISAEFGLDQHVALVGPGGSGKESVALALARLAVPSSGSMRVGSQNFGDLPEAVTGRRIGYIGQDIYLFPQSVRYNILYGLRHRPERPAAYEGEKRRQHEKAMAEALRAGNPTFDPAADWTDYAALGATGPEDLDEKIIEILHTVDFEEDVYQFGLRGTIKPDERPDLAKSIIAARNELHDRLEEPGLAALVEPFDQQRYNRNLSIFENLLFGTAVGDAKAQERLDAYVRQVLDRVGLANDLVAIGIDIARTMIELFADLPPGHAFFEQFSFIASEDLPDYQMLVARVDKEGIGKLDEKDRKRFLALAFPYVEARHRLDQIDAAMEERILGARRALAEQLPADLAPTIEFYDVQRYNAATTLQDNILFGRLVYGQAQAAPRIGALITEVLTHLGLRRAVLVVGLDYPVGIAGKRLTAVQRQKVGLARGLIKQPDLLVVNAATAVFDSTAQARVLSRMLESRKGKGVVWVLDRDDFLDKFDRVLALRDGKLVEPGRNLAAE
jgi:putative ABC transport system ATP-binding protein